MTRFEEVQMKIAEAAKGYLVVYNIQVFIEQFSLTRECRFSLALPGHEEPYTISTNASFTYDVIQTGMSMYKDVKQEDEPALLDSTLELDAVIRLPLMDGYPDIEGLLREIETMFPESEPILSVREFFGAGEPSKEYEISYGYDIDLSDSLQVDVLEGIFEELRAVMELIYERTRYHIDESWYKEDDDSTKGY